jgi:hypothetical protein
MSSLDDESKRSSINDVLTHLNQGHPGIRFRAVDEQNRSREHMRIFVDSERVTEVSAKLKARAEVHVFG